MSLKHIAETTAAEFGVGMVDLMSKRRDSRRARAETWRRCHATGYSFREIAHYFGRHHTAVHRACRLHTGSSPSPE